jgi:hypothetical protein
MREEAEWVIDHAEINLSGEDRTTLIEKLADVLETQYKIGRQEMFQQCQSAIDILEP